jgi:hypothetical protein
MAQAGVGIVFSVEKPHVVLRIQPNGPAFSAGSSGVLKAGDILEDINSVSIEQYHPTLVIKTLIYFWFPA